MTQGLIRLKPRCRNVAKTCGPLKSDGMSPIFLANFHEIELDGSNKL